MVYISLSPSQVDAKSPVDDDLMGRIKDNEDDLDARLFTNKAYDYEFKINGPLANYPVGFRNRLDGALIARAQTFTRARLYLEVPGTSGDCEVDIRKYKKPNTPITAIASQFSAAINSISQVAPNLATQSISLATGTVPTQSISRWKATINVESIILLGSNLVRYNLTSLPDSDWKVGDSVTFAGCTNAANNVTANIVRINDDGSPCIIITNASGVAQTSAAGNAGLNAWSYNYVNPLNSHFVAGESAVFAAHTSGGNDGTFVLYAVNSGGNNLVVKNSAGAAQAGVAGTAQTTRWVFSFLVAASATDFVIGEAARMTSHTSGANNGDFILRAINSSGNNVIVSNNAGVAQGAPAGLVNTTRWIYALAMTPVGSVTAGDTMHPTGTTSAANTGYFVVKEVNRLGTDNLVFSNTAGVAQGGVAGMMQHTRMIFSFATDQASVYSANVSAVELTGCVDANYNTTNRLQVLEVNRGGGANFNIVCAVVSFGVTVPQATQASPAGRVILESRSIFSVRPKLSLPTSITNATNRDMQVDERSSGDFNAEATVVAGDILACDLLSAPNGAPSDVVVQIV